MKTKLVNLMSVLTMVLSTVLSTVACAADNQLSDKEKSSGWQLLFDGRSMAEWRNYQQPDLNERWLVEDGAMILSAKGGGDILTKRSFKNFELKLEWKISEAGNSGIFILVDEKGDQIYSHAPEVQILDNEKHQDNKLTSHLSGSLFDLIASPQKSHRPAGEWNQVRILLRNLHLQVWQNEIQTVDVVLGSQKWEQLVAHSKFANWAGFGKNTSGHIGLQDHGNRVAFKNIKVREL